ncbi:MAG: dihydroorotase [Eggerthellaceae bacterium]|nr:dihydroorotase [Eggerthellaceae bacterium]
MTESATPRYTRLPGFCDVHVHFREPGRTDKETIATGCAAALAGGYTCVCPMPNTTPVMDSVEHLQEQLEIIQRDAPIQVLPYSSISMGESGREVVDMEALAPLCVAFSDDGVGLNDPAVMGEAMQRAAHLGKVIAAHCEDKTLIPAGGCINEGPFAREHGLPGINNESEWAPIARDAALCEETGAAYHVCHVSTAESVEVVRQAKARGANITCEVTPHHLLMDETFLPVDEDGRFKMNPPLRAPEDRMACIAGLLDGTIDMIATDHAPHTAEEKARGLAKAPFGIVGLETAFPLLYTNLVLPGIISLERLVGLMSAAPRARFGIPEPGPDTYTLWDLDTEYVIDASTFAGKCKVSPFDGWRVYGRCVKVVYNGKTVYEIDE